MLFINTEHESMIKTKMIYLYINGVLVDKLRNNQVKKYDLEPGKYQIQVRLNFYVSEPKIIEIKPKKKLTYEITLRSNWKLFTVIVPLMLLGIVINFILGNQFGTVVGYVFLVFYFGFVYFVNSKINRKGYLELKKLKHR